MTSQHRHLNLIPTCFFLFLVESDLKLEIEKLKAVQMSSLGMQSARYKLSQREIEALKLKLRQQEREMAEAHRLDGKSDAQDIKYVGWNNERI